MKFNQQLEDLKNNLNLNDGTEKSSHWLNELKTFKLEDDFSLNHNNFGFGNLEKNTIIRKIYHQFFQRIIFSKNIFHSKKYIQFQKIFELQNRVLDFDIMRHVHTFIYLEELLFRNENINKICIIGDGRTNFLSPSYHLNYFDKIISVNLTETLIVDLLLLEKDDSIRKDEVKVVNTKEEINESLLDKNIKIILVSSQFNRILLDEDIDFFVNICSFQEMTLEVINDYFEIIKSNKSFLYCCNREKKELVGGEIIEFGKYPWGDVDVLFFEECPWHKKWYTHTKFPFIFNYDLVLHKLVKY